MAKNIVQFQKGLSEAAFRLQHGTEEQCRAALFSWRWPQGFVCPKCAGTHAVVLRTRPIQQCSTCRRQGSLIAGTIFHATKLPLTTWFAAIYQLTQSKNGLSSLELTRRLGVSHYTAWKIQHKLMQVMLERDQDKAADRRAHRGGRRLHRGRTLWRQARPGQCRQDALR